MKTTFDLLDTIKSINNTNRDNFNNATMRLSFLVQALEGGEPGTIDYNLKESRKFLDNESTGWNDLRLTVDTHS